MNVSFRILAAALLVIAPLTAHAAEPVANTAVEGLTFNERYPMSECRNVQCYGIGAVRRAFELGRLDSVVMLEQRSCSYLNPKGAVVIPCTVDEDAVGDQFSKVNGEMVEVWNCHTLKCFGRQVIEDMVDRKAKTKIEFPTRHDCETISFELGHSIPCHGQDDPPAMRPSTMDD